MATLDGARWEDVGNKDDFLYVYGGGTDWAAAEAGWEQEHNNYLLQHGWGQDSGGSSGGGDSGGSGGSSGGSGGDGGGSGGGDGGASFSNPANNTAALQAANYAAQIAYQKARLKQLEIPQFKWMKEKDKEELALQEATQEWTKTYQTSLLTGKFNGQDTTAWAAQQAQLTGYFGGAPTLEREKQESDNVFRTAQLLASLRGPRNAFQMANVITNGGLQGILGGASGKYGLPSFGGGSGQPEPVTLQSFLSDASRGITGLEGFNSPYIPGYRQPTVGAGQYGYGATPGSGITPLMVDQMEQTPTGGRVAAVNYSPPGVTAPTNQYNYQGSPDGNSYVYPPGATAPQQAAQVSSPTPVDPSVLNAQTGGGLYGYGSVPGNSQAQAQPVTAAGGAPTTTSTGANDQLQPYQLNAKTVNELNPYNKDLLWSYYESIGWDPAAAEAEFKQSLPKYGGPQAGRVAGVI